MATVDNPNRNFFIVGIGASAGGLDALQRFVAALPVDFGFALVFIQHLSAKHKSLLQELLNSRRPSLVIQQISDGLKVQPGRLYLAPPGKEVRLRNGLFQTTVHPEGLIHLPIDEFLSSLAEDAGERSLAVIFSGAGTDGARGCQAVRAAGGTVYVQDPQTAEFDSMPLAAIATGQPDAVLPPEEIAAELLKLQGLGETVVHREYPITPEEYDGFFQILQKKTGSRFNHYKKSVVSRRIKRRMYLHGLHTVKEYQDLVSANDAEAALLASDLMIGVTSFFRDRVAWKALNLEAVRKITAENTNLPVRVWTPASATGEEAYSIAMMLLRELDLAMKRRDVQVFATDVNEGALERAREGKYPASITADVSQEYVQKYFTPVDDGNFLVINKDVRECVVFAKQDLLSDPPFSKLDLIICRNFLIYLEPEAQEKSITLFHYALKEGGYLFLGNAETVGRKSALFKSIGHKQCRVYRKLETKPASRLPIAVPYATKRQAPSAKGPMTEQSRSVLEIVQEKLLEGYGPAAVGIDQNYEIIYHNGPTNRYLCQPRGVPTQNLLELVPENLRSRIRGALYRSGREERPVVIRTSVAGDDNKTRHVTLRITRAADNLSIVVFQERAGSSKKEAAEQVDAAVIEETAIHQLESELSATRADLQSHIEQLKSMNEEFQSSNEELQAANEELETSREELQSLNEELITVNSQLQGKIEEQDITNNDLNNFLASTNIPTIFLDTHFRVKRFTPAMLKLIKLLPSDVGRPIVDMSQENLGPDLTFDAQTVLDSLVPIRKELAVNGVWYIRTTQPYRTSDSRIEGVVVTYTDITERKRDEEIRGRLSAIVESADEAIISKELDGEIRTWNAGAEKIFGYTAQEAIGRSVSFLVPPGHVDDVPAILKKIAQGEHVEHFETVRMRKDGTIIPVSLTFSPIRDASGRIVGVSKISHDITERKRAEEALKASEEQFRALADSIPNLAWWANADGYITWYNRRWYEYTGTAPEQMEGWGWQSVHDPEALPKVLERWKASISTGEPFDMEFPLRGADGVFRIFLTRIMPLKDSAGRVVRWFGTNTDVSALKRVEDALRVSEERYRNLFNTMDEGFCIIEMIFDAGGRPVDYRFLEINTAFEKQTGLHEATGKSMRELAPTHEAHWFEIYGKIALTGEPLRFVNEARALNRWYDVYAYRVGRPEDRHVAILFSDISEHKRAEEELKLSEERLRMAHQIARIGTFEWDLVKQMTVWSPELEALYGLQPGTIGGRYEEFASRVHPDDLPETEKRICEALDTGTFEAEWRVLWPDGTIRWMAARGQVFKDDTGKPLRMIGVNLDITERKLAEETLRESEEQFRLAIERSPIPVIMHAEDGQVLQISRTWTELTGYSIEDIRTFDEWTTRAVYGEGADEVRDHLKRIFSSSSSSSSRVEFSVLTKAGDLRHWSFSASLPGTLSDGRRFVVGMALDITERKKAEEDIRRAAEFRAAALDRLGEGLYTVDDKGLMSYMNPAAEELFGWSFAELRGKRMHDMTHHHHRDGRPFPIEECIGFRVKTTGQPLKNFEDVFIRKDGTFFDVVYSIAPMRDAAGNVNGLVVVFSDVTERKKAEEDILKLGEGMAARNRELESVNKELESFIYSISHDLRAPIRTISGFAKILSEDYSGKLDAKGEDYLNRILRGSDKSTRLIDDLLHLSKISRQELNRIETDLSKKASKVVEELHEMHQGRNVEVVVQKGMTASVDPRLIELALTNLLGNAWKFTSKTEKARIEFGALDSLLRISDCGLRNEAVAEQVKQGKTVYFIRDNGAGFDMTYADKMFWPFHRLHTDREFEGTGIGLTIVERIVHRHGGKVWAEGEVGKGAVFYFTL